MHLLISTKYTQMDTINNFDELEYKARQALASAMDNDSEKLCFYDDKKSGGGKQ